MAKDRGPVNLPSIHTLFPGNYDMRCPRSPMGNPGQTPLIHGHHALALMERLPSSDSFHSTSSQQYAITYRCPPYPPRKDSLIAVPSPVISAMSSSRAMPIAGELKEECSQCGSHVKPFSECACGHVSFRNPFKINGQLLVGGSDDYFDPRPTSRRGSGAECSTISTSSNPPSRQGSCISFAGITKPARRVSAQTIKSPGQADNHRQVKAKREKESRKEITSGMKRMEVYLNSIGLQAATDLNANNKSKSGLEYKKSEILDLMMKQTKQDDEELFAAYDTTEQLSALLSSGKELRKEDLETLRQARKHAQQRKDAIVAAKRKEKILLEQWTESRRLAEEAPKPRPAKPRPRRTATVVRCPSPRRAVSPGYSHFPGSQMAY